MPILTKAITNELQQWRRKKRPTLSIYPNHIQFTIKEQREIGWDQFLEGLIPKKW